MRKKGFKLLMGWAFSSFLSFHPFLSFKIRTMKKFSKDMMAQCAETLKFLVPYTEKFSNPDYQMPDDALVRLQNMNQKIVKSFLNSPDDVKREFRGIADDVESLRRLDDLIQKTRDGFVSADLKTEIMTVKKRLTSIKVILNNDLGKAPRQGSGCMLPLIILVILAVAGWFFRGTIIKYVPFLGGSENVQTDVDADTGDNEEGDEGDVTTEPETVSEPEPAVTSEPEAEPAEPETPAADAQAEKDAPEKAQPAKKDSKKPSKVGEWRVWKDLNGKSLRARFVKMDGQATIILEFKDKADKGKVKQKGFDIGNFCEKDQQYIRENYLE